jgi:hypothetical protein
MRTASPLSRYSLFISSAAAFKTTDAKALQFVELDDDTQLLRSRDMQGLSMLARAVDPNQTLDGVQEYTTKEALALAQEMVKLGLAKWRGHVDGTGWVRF